MTVPLLYLSLCSFYHGDHDAPDIHDGRSAPVRGDRTGYVAGNGDHDVGAVQGTRPDSPGDRVVEENDSGEVVVVRDTPDSVVELDNRTVLVGVADRSHRTVVEVLRKLVLEALVEVPMVHYLVELMVHFDSVAVVHLESALVSDKVRQLLKVKKSTNTLAIKSSPGIARSKLARDISIFAGDDSSSWSGC